MVGNTENYGNMQDMADAKQSMLSQKIENENINIQQLSEMPKGATDAVQEAGMELKIEVMNLMDALKETEAKDPRYTKIKKEIARTKERMVSWKNDFTNYQKGKQEFFQNLFSFSKANNPEDISMLSDVYGDNHLGYQIIDDKPGIITNNEEYISLNEITGKQNTMMLPANKERNLLMKQAFQIEDTIAKSGMESVNMNQVDHKLLLQRIDSSDGEGNIDPQRPKEYALSTIYDDPQFPQWAEANKIDVAMLTSIIRGGTGIQFRDMVAPALVQFDKEVKIQPSIDSGMQRYAQKQPTTTEQQPENATPDQPQQ